jgi:hypothetical protein
MQQYHCAQFFELAHLKRKSAVAHNERDRGHQRRKLGDLIAICNSQNRGGRCAIGFGDEMMPEPWVRTISEVRTCVDPPKSTDDRIMIDDDARKAEVIGSAQLGHQYASQPLPCAGFLPVAYPRPAVRACTAIHFTR